MAGEWEWIKTIGAEKIWFQRRKKRLVTPVGPEGPELWPADIDGPLSFTKVSDPKTILSSGKMKAAGDDTLKKTDDESD